MSQLVRIANGGLTAAISTLGAELQSLTDARGAEYMTSADPAFWTGHAPLLFPIVGGLNGGRYRLDDAEFELPRHGFARRRQFTLVECTGSAAVFRLADDDDTRKVYPFAFELQVEFRISDSTLEITATIANPGPETLPFSFGYHPAFAWPMPGGGEKLAHTIEFDRDEPAKIRRLDDDGLLAHHETSPVDGRTMPLHPSQFDADAMIWGDIDSRKLIYRGEQGRPALEIAFPGMPYLGIWQKPGADFICIEPWAGVADPAGFDGDFREKPGVILLASGAKHVLRMDVTVRPG